MNCELNKVKAVVDDKIPYIKGQIEKLVEEVVYLPGAKISAGDVRDADILVTRTRTHCNKALLEGSKVRLIVTATIGYDHIDTAYLKEAGIEWHNCPGCNATSVAQYVHNTLLLLQREKGINFKASTLGIIGVGNVGTQVFKACAPLVGRVLLNDPPKEAELTGDAGLSRSNGSAKQADNIYSPLSQLLAECDIITIHTPLVRDGEWPTYHLINDVVLHHFGKKIVLINSGRGEVVDNEALIRALDEGRIQEAVIDTWENEPNISRLLLNKVYIGTPHIAGYSADGKANGTRMSLHCIAEWLERQGDKEALSKYDAITVKAPSVVDTFVPSRDEAELALQLYNPLDDSQRLKAEPDAFERLRGNYPLRREHFD